MTLRDHITLRFARRLIATPAGRAHLLNQLADAESQGESQVFEQVLAQVDDPALKRMVQKHQADEVRHAALFRAAVARTGVEPGPVPSELRHIDRLDRAVGGFLAHPITEPRDVMEAYVMLQVIEERAITQFRIFERAFREIDPETADVFVEVARDEERHLKYCIAIGKRHAPDEATRLATLERYRQLEARCFSENGAANLAYVMERNLFTGGPLARWFWRNVQRLGSGGSLPYTSYHRNPPCARAGAQQPELAVA